MPSFGAAFLEAEDRADAEDDQYYATQEDLWKTKSKKANEQQKLEGPAQDAYIDGAAAPVAAPASSKSKRNHDLVDREDEEYPPAVESLSQISNLRESLPQSTSHRIA
jgi:hypothetical protein